MTGSEKIEFPNGRGELLAGRLEWPAGRPRAWALFAHCFTCGKDIAAATRVARALAARGFAVLRFDFTGLGNSQGDFANTDFSSNVGDLLAAARWLASEHEAPRLLVGHSLGGAAVLVAALDLPEVAAVATIGAPSDVEHLRHLLPADLETLPPGATLPVRIGRRTFPVARSLLDDLERHELPSGLSRLGRPLLLLHAPRDEVVDVDHARRLFEAARHPKSFVSLDDADHLLSSRRDSEFVADLLAGWAGRYVDAAPDAAAGEDPDDEGWVVVEERQRGLAQRIRAGRHELFADEPVAQGGTDTGPTPYGYLLAALGTCTTMTLRLYADRKGWPLERAAVALRHGRIHAADCEDCESETGLVDRIEKELVVEGPLTDEQRERLLEISERCPVHRTLQNEKQILTRLAPAPAG